MKRSTDLLLQDILVYAKQAIAFTANMSFESFCADLKTRYAVFHAIEVIGEAASKVPNEDKQQHPQVPWRAIVDMRNVLIHNYVGINFTLVWQTLKQDLPELISLLEPITKNKDAGS